MRLSQPDFDYFSFDNDAKHRKLYKFKTRAIKANLIHSVSLSLPSHLRSHNRAEIFLRLGGAEQNQKLRTPAIWSAPMWAPERWQFFCITFGRRLWKRKASIADFCNSRHLNVVDWGRRERDSMMLRQTVSARCVWHKSPPDSSLNPRAEEVRRRLSSHLAQELCNAKQLISFYD